MVAMISVAIVIVFFRVKCSKLRRNSFKQRLFYARRLRNCLFDLSRGLKLSRNKRLTRMRCYRQRLIGGSNQ